MSRTRAIAVMVGLLGMVSAALAQDILELRSGSVLRGSFMGGTANTVRFDSGRGVDVFERDEVMALTFGGSTMRDVSAPAPAPAPVAAAAPAPAPAPAQPTQFTLPSGTILLVSMDATISTARNRQDERFTATLAHDVLSNGAVVIPSGTRVFGRIASISGAGRVAGRPEIRLRLRELDMNGRLVEIRTTSFTETGDSSFRGTARNAGLGAGVGAAFGGGQGAARGAAIGGATSVLTQGDTITIPAGTVLEFRLSQPLTHSR